MKIEIMQLTNEDEVNRDDKISKEGREDEHYRRRSDGESAHEWDRAQDRRYLDEFEKVFSGEDDRDGSGIKDDVKESASETRDSNWDSEYDTYEDW